MSTPVSPSATAFALASVRTAQPVVTGGMARLAEEISFITGHNVHKIGEGWVLPRETARSQLEGLAHTIRVPYARSSGARVLRVTVELHTSDEIADSQTVTTTLPTGGSWLDAGGLDGSITLYNPPRGRTAPREYVGFADVTGVTVGDLTTDVVIACTPSAKGAGVRRVSIVEVPLAGLGINASEPGWDAAATRAGRLVVDGGASSPRGMQRLFHLLDQGRSNWRKHFALIDIETADTTGFGTTPHWSRAASTSGVIDWGLGSGAADPTWYLHARRLYSGATTTYDFRVRYRTSNGTNCQVSVYLEGGSIASSNWSIGAAAASPQTLTLPGTSGAWAWANTTVMMPNDTDGLCKVWFRAKGPGTGQLLSLATLALTENEP
jgi:hypothetical protein